MRRGGESMAEIEFKGKTVLEAIDKGLSQLGCSKDDVKIKIVTEGSKGLFGLMGTKPAIILMSVDNSKCTNKALFVAGTKNICKKVEAILSNIISKMGIDLAKIGSSFKDNVIDINIKIKENSFAIDEDGQTLASLEYITQIIVNKEFGTNLKVNLNCQNCMKK
jgi:spoIIIJ-associated protein